MIGTHDRPSRSGKRRAQGRGAARLITSVFLTLILLTPPQAWAQRQLVEPETSVAVEDKALAAGRSFMIATANRHASEAGREMLAAGGSAMDAAIAAQLVLGLAEPQSSGLGGGAFILNWDQPSQSLAAYDGRETAPAAAKPDRFLRDGNAIDFEMAVKSGLSIGTPGLVRLLEHAHKRHGKLPWAQLFAPAIRLSDEGFAVSRRLHFLLMWNGAAKFAADARRYFFDANGSAWPTGHVLKNPDYAATLRAIAAGGADAFYRGPIAEAIAAAARAAPNYAGDLTAEDLAAYRVKDRASLCVPYRSFRVCGLGAPSSGGVAVAQILQLLEPFDLGKGRDAAMSTRAMHLIVEAEKLAYADRDRYVADPDFVPVPPGLTDKGYLDGRRKLINLEAAMPPPPAGEPPGLDKRAFGADGTIERPGTSHISVIDAEGNAVSMTTTIEGVFGSGVMAAGFLLNNELTDFSLVPAGPDGVPAANRVEGGKRPRSTMAPTIVFDDKGEVFALLGSPGGGRIVFYVVKALTALIDWEMDAQAATALRNFGSMGGPVELEYGWRALRDGLGLKSYGHAISGDLMNSGLNIVVRRNGRLEGGSDPRRDGIALGEGKPGE